MRTSAIRYHGLPHLGPNISFNGDYNLRPKMPDSERSAFPLHQDSTPLSAATTTSS